MPFRKAAPLFCWRSKRAGLALALITATLLTPASANAAAVPAHPMGAQDLRLATVGYRLSRAHPHLCGAGEMLTGLVLHDLSQYKPKDRQLVSETFSLKEGIGILGVVANSPGARAGLRQGDEILSIGTTDLRDPRAAFHTKQPSFHRMEGTLALLEMSLRSGVTPIQVKRGTTIFTISLHGEKGCGGRFNVSQSASRNAWSDGSYVEVTSAIMDFTENDDELALVVAHEMSHNILQHSLKLASGPNGLFGAIGFGTRKVKSAEIEADSYAVGIMVRAGFDVEKAVPLLQRAARSRWWDVAIDHPGIQRRIGTIRSALSEFCAAEMSQKARVKCGSFTERQAIPASEQISKK